MRLSTVSAFKNIRSFSGEHVVLEGELLQKYQRAVLKITEDIIEICEREHIRYHLGGGSCLGAVRHGGFIPWDDDMDINILRSEYGRFKDSFLRAYGGKYWVLDSDSPKYSMPYVQIRRKGSVARGRNEPDSGEIGIGVDVFLVENTFDSKLLRTLHGVLCMGAGFMLSRRTFYKNRKLMLEVAKDNPSVKRAFYLKVALGWFLSFLPADAWMRFVFRVYGQCKNDKSKYVSIPSGRQHYFKEMYLREGMAETVPMPFEGHRWQVPKDYDGYLKNLYGPDYMTPPPEAERESHVLLELRFPDET